MRRLAAALVLWITPAATCGRNEVPPTIEEAKARYAPEFMRLPGVVSVGIGRDVDGAPVLVVGLDQERPETRAALPRQVEGHGVRVEVTGLPRAQ
ncbi:MAG TPA: hypothetical protein VD707_00070 [Gemmatimonadales bacterium]|nr:hypothetical protein [Gemmatimonadales bacterium]